MSFNECSLVGDGCPLLDIKMFKFSQMSGADGGSAMAYPSERGKKEGRQSQLGKRVLTSLPRGGM